MHPEKDALGRIIHLWFYVVGIASAGKTKYHPIRPLLRRPLYRGSVTELYFYLCF